MQPQPIPQANPSQMLPSNLLRGNPSNAGAIFQQSPLTQNMGNGAMGSQGLQTPPPAGSQAINQGMPPPMPGQAPQAGQPDNGQQQMSEAQYILQALADRLKHHSKITEKTVSTLSDMISSQLPTPAPSDLSQGQGTPS